MKSKSFENSEEGAKGLITGVANITSLVFTSGQKYFAEYIV
jgi:hypothetical protein